MKRLVLLGMLLFPLPLVAGNATGKVLYDQNCAVCHGYDGHGGVGVPLALPAFLSTVSNDFLFSTIRNGRPGRVMPAFRNLSDRQISAIVRYIRSWQPGSEPRDSAVTIRGDMIRGGKLFKKYCASCHGDRAQGSPGTGVTFSRPRNLPIMAPALNNSGFLKAASNAMLLRTITQGRKGTPMPSAASMGLKQKDIHDIIAWLRHFEKRHASRKQEKESPVIVQESSYDLKTTVNNVKQAARGKNFRIIRVQYLDQGLVEPGKEDRRKVIIYFCNFNLLNKALALDPRVGLFLPCRVTVIEHKGRVKVVSINPTMLSHLFNNEELDRMCKEMKQTYMEIIEEATL